LDPEVQCVAVGFDHHFNYPKMVEATSYAYKNESCLFVATNDDAVFPSSGSNKVVIPGTGTFVNAVKTSVGRDPVILGKPHPTMWEVLHQLHGLDPNRSCMVGDRLDTDIAFAANCGLGFSLAVLSGICTIEEIDKYSEIVKQETKRIQSDENNNKKKDEIRAVYGQEARLAPDFFTDCLGEFEKMIR
jgi:ribonucleotide monophosphatase NagD (HAD superfamily)